MAAAPLAAQRVSAFAHQPTGTSLTPPARKARMGPQVNPAWHPVKPAFARETASSSSSDSHTITLSTIALVLVVVIVVLLIVR
jgi:hypothetical protein